MPTAPSQPCPWRHPLTPAADRGAPGDLPPPPALDLPLDLPRSAARSATRSPAELPRARRAAGAHGPHEEEHAAAGWPRGRQLARRLEARVLRQGGGAAAGAARCDLARSRHGLAAIPHLPRPRSTSLDLARPRLISQALRTRARRRTSRAFSAPRPRAPPTSSPPPPPPPPPPPRRPPPRLRPARPRRRASDRRTRTSAARGRWSTPRTSERTSPAATRAGRPPRRPGPARRARRARRG